MVIVLSLVIASVGLPWLLRRMPVAPTSAASREAGWARRRAARAALRSVASAAVPQYPDASAALATRSRRATTPALPAPDGLEPPAGTAPTPLLPVPAGLPGLAEAVRDRVLHGYIHRLLADSQDAAARHSSTQALALERLWRLQALQSERDELHRLRMSDRINDETLRQLIREIDLVEVVLRSRPVG